MLDDQGPFPSSAGTRAAGDPKGTRSMLIGRNFTVQMSSDLDDSGAVTWEAIDGVSSVYSENQLCFSKVTKQRGNPASSL